MNSFRKAIIPILYICMALLAVSCSPKEEVSSVEEVDISSETKVVEAFGIVKVEETKHVTIDFPALVLDVYVKEGQHLDENQSIMTLDLSEFQTQISDKKNELNIANLEYQRISKTLQGTSLENNQIDKNKLSNDLEYSKKLFEQAAKDYTAMEMLYATGAVSKEEINQSKINLDKTQINMKNIEYELQSIENNITYSTDRDQLDIQKNRIEQIKNNISLLESKLTKPYIVDNKIVSEFKNAAIHEIAYGSGHMVDITQRAFSISNLDSLIIEANVVEEFINDVKMGETVRIVPIADRTREYTGKVIYVSQMAFKDNGETIVPIRISIDNMDEFLMPNYNVDVYIDVE